MYKHKNLWYNAYKHGGCDMAYVNNEKEPELLFIIECEEDEKEVTKIASMVENMNNDLVDSGFSLYQYVTEIIGKKVYVRRV
jgi:hypothetical protein